MEIGTPLRCPCLESDISVTSLLLGALDSQVQSVWQLAAVAAQVGLLQVLLRRVQHWSIGVLCPDEPKNPSKKSITNLTYTVLRSQES